MKSKLQWVDLALCAGCFLFVLLQRTGWQSPAYFLVALSMALRFVVSFSLANRETRTWIPLLLFYACYGLLISCRVSMLSVNIMSYISAITGITYNYHAALVISGLLFLWIMVLPLVYYLVLLFRHKLVKTELKMKNLFCAILWHDRTAQYFMAVFLFTLLTLLIGLSMQTRLCFLTCLSAAPAGYWLVCKYQGIKAKRLWLIVVAMILFWYAQPFCGILRATILGVSFCMVVSVCVNFLKETKKYLLTFVCTLYLGVLIPSFTIGYNQYACINYPRAGFGHMPGYQGILYIKNSMNCELIGLRDRYGLLVSPVYENIRMGEAENQYYFGCCRLQKNGYSQIYDIGCNEIIPSERDAQLQAVLSKILKDYCEHHCCDYQDEGEIRITNLSTDKVIAHVQIKSYGVLRIVYDRAYPLPDDSVFVTSGTFHHADSVLVHETREYGHFKNLLSYSENLPNDSDAHYNVYIRFAQSESTQTADISSLMQEVRNLMFFRH